MENIRLGSIAGVPVTVSPWYFVLLAYFGWSMGMRDGLLWIACVTVSILIHEFGHAGVAARFRLSPSVTLHGWGGLCAHEPAERDRDDALIVFAGPLAGLVFGGLVFAADILAGDLWAGHATANKIVSYLLYINLFWSLINLLPLWPLDGGQLFRLFLLQRIERPAKAERVTHMVGLGLGVACAFAGYYYLGSDFAAVLAMLIALQNIERVGSTDASGVIRSKSRFARGLLGDAQAALDAGDYREAARLGHQVRHDSQVRGPALEEMWRILGIATARLGEHDEALTYLHRAPPDEEVVAERASCAMALERRDEAEALLRDHPKLLSEELRAKLEALTAAAS